MVAVILIKCLNMFLKLFNSYGAEQPTIQKYLLGRLLACSLAPLICLLRAARALLCAHLFARLLTHYRICGKANDKMSHYWAVLNRSAMV